MTAVHTDINRARDEICRVGASLFARGYVHATAGNISVRLAPEAGGGFLITPTDACLGNLRPEYLAHVADDGTALPAAGPARHWRCTAASTTPRRTRVACCTPIRRTWSR